MSKQLNTFDGFLEDEQHDTIFYALSAYLYENRSNLNFGNYEYGYFFKSN